MFANLLVSSDAVPTWAKRLLIPLAKEVVKAQRIRLDAWTPSKRSRDENPGFKSKLIKFYCCEHPTDNRLVKCMLLNDYLPKSSVIGSHIYKAATYGSGLEDFGLRVVDLWNERNGMLLYQSIEKAFDVKEVCFIYNSLRSQLCILVLKPDLLGEKVLSPVDQSTYPSLATITFSDLNGRPLQLPAGIFPFRRILSFHAKCSLRYAVGMTWIGQETADSYLPYFDLSEGASEPNELDVESLVDD